VVRSKTIVIDFIEVVGEIPCEDRLVVSDAIPQGANAFEIRWKNEINTVQIVGYLEGRKEPTHIDMGPALRPECKSNTQDEGSRARGTPFSAHSMGKAILPVRMGLRPMKGDENLAEVQLSCSFFDARTGGRAAGRVNREGRGFRPCQHGAWRHQRG